MIRARLRAWLMRWAFGEDPRLLVADLRAAGAAMQATHAEQSALRDRIEQLEHLTVDVLLGLALDVTDNGTRGERVTVD